MSVAQLHPSPVRLKKRAARFDRSTARILVTMAMYVGAAIALYPYATDRISSGLFFVLFGVFVVFTSALLRCFLMDCKGDRDERPAEMQGRTLTRF